MDYESPLDVAFNELIKFSGSQFDPAVIEAFLSANFQEKLGMRACRMGCVEEPGCSFNND